MSVKMEKLINMNAALAGSGSRNSVRSFVGGDGETPLDKNKRVHSSSLVRPIAKKHTSLASLGSFQTLAR
ncbi:hypothetical protein PGT21_015693 [Puccinia graminis f. sp. tritici]|uniref:Uncharacterized protein n=1 Tax=Puccinia graminis f. sp. tritici TaxID=56615 RepID=A0A5B0LKN3_PUCGR|nr:hypothetical protein PGT21_015693 [Puccinia graminis f. sp. tritici]